jgi:hypothetical protein
VPYVDLMLGKRCAEHHQYNAHGKPLYIMIWLDRIDWEVLRIRKTSSVLSGSKISRPT